MINELKAQVEKTFGQKIARRQHAELLAQDIYLKTNILVSYNTIRRFFGMVAHTTPRQTTLDTLAVYCGFKDFLDFSRQFPSIDIWPKWEGLFLALNSLNLQDLIAHLLIRKNEYQDFAVSFSLAVKELLNHEKGAEVVQLFRAPAFQFANLSFDDASQIGVILGLHFNHFDHWEIEQLLLHEKNFRDLVLKTNVDYTRFNGKYGKWITYLSALPNLETDTAQFISSLKPFMFLLNKQSIPEQVLAQIPPLKVTQHPILFGRIFCLKIMLAPSNKQRRQLEGIMKKRLAATPELKAELLYVPAIHALLTKDKTLTDFVFTELQELPIAQKWYQISLISIEKIFLAAHHIQNQDFQAAKALLDSSPIEQIRFGYKLIVDIYITYFQLEIAKQHQQPTKNLQQQFKAKLSKVNLPLLSEEYFAGYFELN
ncbi:MAG: hypothetical protein ACKOWW_07745 [Flavobacteriales bacterium]